ncbi:TPA: restriction endonuclease subunit S [Neisseria subflava]|mgnify:FL=1
MSDWKIYTISEACKRFSSGKGITASQIFEIGAYPVFGGNGIRGYTDAYNFEGECAIIGRQGAYCGNTKYFCGKAYMTEHAIVATANDEHNIGYIANLLSIMNLGQYQGQSAQPGLSVNTLSKIELKLPDKKTQDSIFSLLSALDKKIALNKQINARLEEIAKTLYDYWFVQFDFPDANGKPYKSSGGEMVFDETLKREIPKGWEVKSLGEIALTSSGGTPTSTVQEYYKGGNIPWINSGELNNNFIVHTDNFITQTGMDNSSAKLVSEKSILLAMYGATAGKTSLISFKTTTNQAICSILPKDMNYRVYIKSYLDNMYLYLVQLSSGSARDNLSQDEIKRLHLVIPESGILEIFSNVTEDFYKKIENNLKQNYHMTQLRDFLLPMLMNGQVSVAE